MPRLTREHSTRSVTDTATRKGSASDRNETTKDFFVAEKLKTRTEKDYLMHLAEKPVMQEMEIEGNEPISSAFYINKQITQGSLGLDGLEFSDNNKRFGLRST